MDHNVTLLITFATLALAISFLCSLLESVLLSIPAGHVSMLAEKGTSTGKRLQRMKGQIDRPLSAILTLNTIANTAGATGVGAEAMAIFGEPWLGAVSAVMTLLVLVISEVIPKTIGAAYAIPLAGFTAVTVWLLTILTWPAVVVLDGITRVIGHRRGAPAPSRAELLAAARLGLHAGALRTQEVHVLKNLLSLEKTRVRDILTPRTVIAGLSADTTVGDALGRRDVMRYSRIPVFEDSIENIVGYVARIDVIDAQHDRKSSTLLSALARPMRFVPEVATVRQLLDTMLQKREHIVGAVNEYGGLEGIVTLEDAIETLLGREIVDESDTTPDLQEHARRLARQRGGQSHG